MTKRQFMESEEIRDRKFYKEWIMEQHNKVVSDTDLDNEEKKMLLLGLTAKIASSFVLDITWDDDIYYETDLNSIAEIFADHTHDMRHIFDNYIYVDGAKDMIKITYWTEQLKQEWIKDYGIVFEDDTKCIYELDGSSVIGVETKSGKYFVIGSRMDTEVENVNDLITIIRLGL